MMNDILDNCVNLYYTRSLLPLSWLLLWRMFDCYFRSHGILVVKITIFVITSKPINSKFGWGLERHYKTFISTSKFLFKKTISNYCCKMISFQIHISERYKISGPLKGDLGIINRLEKLTVPCSLTITGIISLLFNLARYGCLFE